MFISFVFDYGDDINTPFTVHRSRGSVVSWGTILQVGRSRDWIPMDFFFNLPDPYSRTMPPGSTHPLTEMSTRNIPGDKGRQARKADSLTAIYEPIV
jgi:hypothetical protein